MVIWNEIPVNGGYSGQYEFYYFESIFPSVLSPNFESSVMTVLNYVYYINNLIYCFIKIELNPFPISFYVMYYYNLKYTVFVIMFKPIKIFSCSRTNENPDGDMMLG